MDRKDFIKKGLLGTGMFITTAALGDVIINNIDELTELEPLVFIIYQTKKHTLWQTPYYTNQTHADTLTMVG